MASLGIRNHVNKNLLDENRINPWWEKIRSYCSAATMGLSLIMMLIAFPKPDLVCLPMMKDSYKIHEIGENLRPNILFSQPQFIFINSYCPSQMPLWARYSGIFATAASIFVIVFADLWMYIPSVAGAIRTFAKAENMIDDANLSISELEKVLDEEDENPVAKQISGARLLLTSYNRKPDISKIYLCRSFGLLIITLLALVLACVLSYFLNLCLDQIRCKFDPNSYSHNDWDKNLLSHDEIKTMHFSLSGFKVFFCVYNNAKQQYPVSIAVCVLFLFQIVSSFIGLVVTHRGFSCRSYESREEKFAKFMLFLWKNSQPLGGEEFPYFVQRVFETPQKTNCAAPNIGFCDNCQEVHEGSLPSGGRNGSPSSPVTNSGDSLDESPENSSGALEQENNFDNNEHRPLLNEEGEA